MSDDLDALLREVIGDVPRVIALAARIMREVDKHPHDGTTDAVWVAMHDIKRAAQDALAAAKKAVEE